MFHFTKESKPTMGPTQPFITLLPAAFSTVDKADGA